MMCVLQQSLLNPEWPVQPPAQGLRLTLLSHHPRFRSVCGLSESQLPYLLQLTTEACSGQCKTNAQVLRSRQRLALRLQRIHRAKEQNSAVLACSSASSTPRSPDPASGRVLHRTEEHSSEECHLCVFREPSRDTDTWLTSTAVFP